MKKTEYITPSVNIWSLVPQSLMAISGTHEGFEDQTVTLFGEDDVMNDFGLNPFGGLGGFL